MITPTHNSLEMSTWHPFQKSNNVNLYQYKKCQDINPYLYYWNTIDMLALIYTKGCAQLKSL